MNDSELPLSVYTRYEMKDYSITEVFWKCTYIEDDEKEGEK